MDKFERQFQEIEMLKKKVSFLEKKIIPKKLTQLDFIMEDFLDELVVTTSKQDSIAFDKKLNRNGVYSKFLHFYFLYYSTIKINLHQKIVRIEFEKALHKLFSYDLTKNVIRQASPYRDISYKYLKFKNEEVLKTTTIPLNIIMDAFIKENLEISLTYNTINFDANLQSYGIYPRFLHFYFLYYSFISINLNAFNVLEYFNESLIINFSYDLTKYSINNKKLEQDIVYKYLQFKKN